MSPGNDPKQPGIQINRIFVSRALLEHGELAYNMPDGQPIPPIRFSVNYRSHPIGDDGRRAVGLLTVLSEKPDPFFYNIQVQLTALVSVVEGEENISLAEYMGPPLATTLYPFAREAVAALTGRGRHGSIYLKPFNVQAMFSASKEAEAPAAPAARPARKK